VFDVSMGTAFQLGDVGVENDEFFRKAGESGDTASLSDLVRRHLRLQCWGMYLARSGSECVVPLTLYDKSAISRDSTAKGEEQWLVSRSALDGSSSRIMEIESDDNDSEIRYVSYSRPDDAVLVFTCSPKTGWSILFER